VGGYLFAVEQTDTVTLGLVEGVGFGCMGGGRGPAGIGHQDDGLLEPGGPIGAVGVGQMVARNLPDAVAQTGGQSPGEDLRGLIDAGHIGGNRGQLRVVDAAGVEAIANRLLRELDRAGIGRGLQEHPDAMLVAVETLLLDRNRELASAHQSSRPVVPQVDAEVPTRRCFAAFDHDRFVTWSLCIKILW